jgi:hypothetical protein
LTERSFNEGAVRPADDKTRPVTTEEMEAPE